MSNTLNYKNPLKKEEIQRRLWHLFGDQWHDKVLNMEEKTDNDLVNRIERLVEEDLQQITKNQLRNIFNLLHDKRVNLSKLPGLRPKLAYYAAKNTGKEERRQLQVLTYLLDQLIRKVSTNGQLKSLHLFLEAVVAYHRFELDIKKKNNGSIQP